MITVYFVEDQLYWHTIGLSGSKKTVNKNSGGNRIVDRHDQHRLVHIRSNDMRLFGQIGSTADDVVLSLFDLGDKSGPFGIDIDIDPVPDRNRIGGTNIFQAKNSL